ncbi:CD109 antigen-like, partial [Pollicipes pollicipes]
MRWCCAVLTLALLAGLAVGQTPSSENDYVVLDPLVPEGAAGRYDLEFRTHRSPRYLVLASRLVRPGTIFRVLAVLLGSSGPLHLDTLQYPLDVRASVSRDGVEIASSMKTMGRGDIQIMMMKIPSTSTQGSYRLRLEGDHEGSVGGSVFVNETRLEFAQRFLTVLIQTSRPIYNFGQTVQFRVVMLRTDLKPFDDPIDVYVLDSDGYIMRRWPSESSNNGVVALQFNLPFIGKGGWWRIRVNVRGQLEEKLIKLTKYFVPQWEAFVWMPTYFLLSEDAIAGEVSAAYTSDKVIRGNVTLELHAKPGPPYADKNTPYTFITSYVIPQFANSDEFSFPMSALQGALPNLNNAKVKVIARVTEYWLNETYIGWCNSKLINSTVSIKFLGASPQLYKPGMPFVGQVLVTYHDLAPLSREELEGSTLTIRSTGDAGGEIRIPSVREWRDRFTWRNSSFWNDDRYTGVTI